MWICDSFLLLIIGHVFRNTFSQLYKAKIIWWKELTLRPKCFTETQHLVHPTFLLFRMQLFIFLSDRYKYCCHSNADPCFIFDRLENKTRISIRGSLRTLKNIPLTNVWNQERHDLNKHSCCTHQGYIKGNISCLN